MGFLNAIFTLPNFVINAKAMCIKRKFLIICLLLLVLPYLSDGQIITTICGTGSGTASGDGGPATAAGCTPFDLRMDAAGNITFSDRLNQRMRRINTAGIITTCAGTGAIGYAGDGGPATNAELNVLNGMTFDLSGKYYIADGPNNRIRVVNGAGIISTFAGTGFWGSSGDGGPATSAEIADSYGLTVDDAGNIYIADSYNNRIRKISTSGIITNFAGNGGVGFSGDGGPATNAQLSWPTGMIADHLGNLYITDDENNRIRKINAAGIITTIAGDGSTGVVPGAYTGSYTGDGGPATLATLNTPVYLTMDACGNIYFSDAGNNVLRKISTSGIITTFCGTSPGGFAGDGGPATAAQIYRPTGITFDNAGNIIFADQGNARIRKVTMGLSFTTAARDTTVCPGTPVTLFADTPGSYLWSNSATTPSITTDSAGTYWVRSSTGTCSMQIDTVHILNATIPVNLGQDTAFCTGNSITLDPAVLPGSTVTWSTGYTGPAITVTATGTYWVTVTNGSCISRDTIHVIVNPAPAVNLGPDQSLCIGTPDTLRTAGSYPSASYLWSTGSTAPDIIPTTSGTYWLQVSEAGCTRADTVQVNFMPAPTVDIPPAVLCPFQTLVLGSPEPPGVSYLWSTGSTDSSIKVSVSGKYTLTVTLGGCKASGSVTVVESAPYPIHIGNDTTLCTGESLVLNVNSAEAIWGNDHKGPFITVTTSGKYWVTVPEQCGASSDTVNVTFAPCDIFFPSAFTPNDDGLNDFARAIGDMSYVTGFSLSIYNRWGQRVYYSEDKYAGWDGTFNGEKQGLGTFFYMLYYTLQNSKHMLKGDLALIR